MKADFYEEGAELIVNGETLEQIFFIEKGSVDLIVYDKDKGKHILETLR
jgi:CRP-like cAMP-binding protein